MFRIYSQIEKVQSICYIIGLAKKANTAVYCILRLIDLNIVTINTAKTI